MKRYKVFIFCLMFLMSTFTQVSLSLELNLEKNNHLYDFNLRYKGNNNYQVSLNHLKTNDDIRSPAEFEIVDELIISWPKGFKYWNLDVVEEYFIDIIVSAEDAVIVNIVVDNSSEENKVLSILNNNNIPLSNITFTRIETNTIWIRDYGPFFVEKNNELSVVDINYFNYFWSTYGYIKNLLNGHIYSIRDYYRSQDNFLPIRYAKNYLFDYSFVLFYTLQGGNYISDGQGTGFVGDIIFSDNPFLTENQVEKRLKQLLGLNELIILKSQITRLNKGGDGTGHIDMFSKILDNDNVLVGQWSSNDPNYQIVEENVQKFENLGYNIIRIPMLRNPNDPDDYNNKTIWSYTNSLIINGINKKVVLLPIYGVEEDAIAISIYEQAMPDYEIRGILSDYIIELCGAVHCTTITRPLI